MASDSNRLRGEGKNEVKRGREKDNGVVNLPGCFLI